MTSTPYSAALIREIILNDYPDLPLEDVDFYHTLHSHIYSAKIAGKEFIFKFPLNDHYNMIQEIRILSHLRHYFQLAIPQIAFVGRRRPYIAYPRLTGETLSVDDLAGFSSSALDRLAEDAAKFIKTFHNMSKDVTEALAITEDPSRHYPERIRKFVSDKDVNDEYRVFIDRVLNRYEQWAGQGNDIETFVYNDLHLGNMLFDRERQKLTGIVDFGFCGIGRVHRDFHQFHKHGVDLLRRLIASYRGITGHEINYDLVVVYSTIDMLGYMVGGYEQRPELVNNKIPLFTDIVPWMKDPDIQRILD